MGRPNAEGEGTMRKPVGLTAPYRQDDDDIQDYVKPLVGLTPQEVSDIWDSMGTWNSTSAQHFYNAIWKAIKEKNSA